MTSVSLEGSLVRAKIVTVDQEHVFLALEGGLNGSIAAWEFEDLHGDLQASKGQEVDVLVEWFEPSEGRFEISKIRADKLKVWSEIRKSVESGLVEGVIEQRVKGGLTVDIGIEAFLPASEIESRVLSDAELAHLIGKRLAFEVLKHDPLLQHVVLSRKNLVEKERKRKAAERKAGRAEKFASLQEGQILEGVVKNIEKYGVFVDLGGIDGLVHITDASWDKNVFLPKIFQPGQSVRVKILKLEGEKERISLGVKQLTQDPWRAFLEEHPIGSTFQGKVKNTSKFGVFVQLAPKIEGLIHISELSWTKEGSQPSAYTKDQVVEVKILSLDPNEQRVSLSIRQLKPDPWKTSLPATYRLGSVHQATIKRLTKFGAFAELAPEVEGLIHVSEITEAPPEDLSSLLQIGQEVPVKIISFDPDKRQIRLSMRQADGDSSGYLDTQGATTNLGSLLADLQKPS